MMKALQQENTLRQKVISGLTWSVGLKFLGQSLTWLITIFIMRRLSPQDYGLMGMAGIAITYLAAVNELGLAAFLIQNRTLDVKMISQIFGLLLVVNVGLFVSCFLLAPIISSFFSEPRLVGLIRLLAVQFILAAFVVIPQSLIDREMLFRQKSTVDLVSAIFSSLTTLTLVLNGFGVWSLVWGSLTLRLFRTVGLNLIKPYLHLPRFSFKKMRQCISFGGYVAVARMLWLLYINSDILIVGKLLGKQLLGYYNVALTLASLPMEKISGALNQVAFPAFASIQNDIQQATKNFLKAVRIMSLLAFPVLWGISSVAPQLMELLIGKRWAAAILPLRILGIIIPVRMISTLMGPTLLGLGRPDIAVHNVITAALLLPLGFLVGCQWGIAGVSISWVTVFPIVFLINLKRLTGVLRIGPLNVISSMFRPLVGATLMYIVVVAMGVVISQFDPSFRLVLSITCGAVTYIGSIFILDRRACYEVLSLLRSK